MIAAPPPSAPAIAPATVSARFAPPLGRTLVYVMTDRHPFHGGQIVVTLTQSLRFERDAAGVLTAAQTALGDTIEAPPPVRAAIEALQAPFRGVTTRVTLTPEGLPDTVVDGEATWAHVQESFAALGRQLDEDKAVAPADLAAARAALAAQIPHDAAAIDARLRESVALLLPPPLPPLQAGESRAFATTTGGPGVTVRAHGQTRLVSIDPERMIYHIHIASDHGAADGGFVEDVELDLDHRTGLVRRLHSVRSIHDGQGPASVIAERTIALQS